MQTAFVEGYGCSLNKAETQQLKAFLKNNGFKLVEKPENAGLTIINTCAVKEPTEQRMLSRIRKLWAMAKKSQAQLVVFGCLPKINAVQVRKISGEIKLVGPSLKELAAFLKLREQEFSPLLAQERENKFVSIIPIARGCLGACSFCGVRQARGKLKSYPVKELKACFEKSAKEAPEIWLTAQDTGSYGKDLGESLPGLLKELLKNPGNYRVRIGMMNPEHLKWFFGEFARLFEDKRLYRFFHVPLQSGSDRILKAMKRNYSAKDFLGLVARLKKSLPDATFSTDIIVGFPGETEKDFEETARALKKFKPDIVNVSCYGDRPNTEAKKLPGKLLGEEKRKRSKKLAELCKAFGLAKKKKLLGKTVEILVTEKGSKGGFVGRTQNYLPVVIAEDRRGEFVKVKIVKAEATFLVGKVL